MKQEDRRKASTDARIELRKQAMKLRSAGKTLAEISEITGYKVPYLSTMLRQLAKKPGEVSVLRRGGRPKSSGRALTLVQERQVQGWVCRRCCPDQLQLPFALWTRKADETGLRSDESRHRGYSPRVRTPTVTIPARRKSLSLISSITNQDKVRFMIYPGALKPETLIKFMGRLIRDADKKVFLILDNLNVYKSRRVGARLGEHDEQTEVFYLPLYSPELNPDEYLNGDLKRAVHRDVSPKDAQELKTTAQIISRFMGGTSHQGCGNWR